MGLEIEICTTEQSKGGWREGGAALYSVSSRPCEKRRRSDGEGMRVTGSARSVSVCQCCTVLAQRCHCQMLTS